VFCILSQYVLVTSSPVHLLLIISFPTCSITLSQLLTTTSPHYLSSPPLTTPTTSSLYLPGVPQRRGERERRRVPADHHRLPAAEEPQTHGRLAARQQQPRLQVRVLRVCVWTVLYGCVVQCVDCVVWFVVCCVFLCILWVFVSCVSC